ncbi:MAG: zf-HC2 domain-containing protein [Anaerolineae bacterium]|nr:zf-HC2 domain-containing protein [Anaerolineae bacterium]
MKNDTYAEKISLWLDDQLSLAEVAELKAHLAGCPSCRRTYEGLQRVHQLFQTAATRMVSPEPGFSHRLEARLARHHAVSSWQIWAAILALCLGTLVIFGAWAIVGGLSLVNTGVMLLDAGIFYQGFIAFIESVDGIRILMNLGSLLLKAGFITVQQPLFWGGVLVTVSLIGLWIWLMRGLLRRAMAPVELLV